MCEDNSGVASELKLQTVFGKLGDVTEATCIDPDYQFDPPGKVFFSCTSDGTWKPLALDEIVCKPIPSKIPIVYPPKVDTTTQFSNFLHK